MQWNFRNVTAFIFANVLIMMGLVSKACKKAFKGDFILSIYFHNPSKKEFESIVKWLVNKKFNFISLSDLKGMINGELPFPKGAVLITVDDGWESNGQNIVEIANTYKVPVAIFVSTEPAEKGAYWWSYVKEARRRKMNFPTVGELKKVPNQDRLSVINEIKKRINLPREAMAPMQIQCISHSQFITIGGHTHTHPVLVNCGNGEVKRELILSKQKLEAWTGKKVDTFAYPNGNFSDREIKILKELKYNVGFGNTPDYLTKENLSQHYQMPRFGFLEGASFKENICRVVGVWKQSTKSIYPK